MANLNVQLSNENAARMNRTIITRLAPKQSVILSKIVELEAEIAFYASQLDILIPITEKALIGIDGYENEDHSWTINRIFSIVEDKATRIAELENQLYRPIIVL